jgi:hypothetical protein
MRIEQKARFLTESIRVVIDPAQDSRQNVDVSPQRLQIAPHGEEGAGDQFKSMSSGMSVISGGSMRVCGIRTGVCLSLSPADLDRLVGLVKGSSRAAPQKHVWRAQIVCSAPKVSAQTRSCRILKLDPSIAERVVALTMEAPPGGWRVSAPYALDRGNADACSLRRRCAGPMRSFREGRVLSRRSPSTPSAAKRQRQTQVLDLPISLAGLASLGQRPRRRLVGH